ncbi:MAG: hypothetical protein IBX70_04565 [Clostridia bacterium]|nr:hypothetical protein [Clostridia bacterium]
MYNRFTFFDLETPNRFNDRICAFGLIHMVDDEIVFEQEFLVNPEVYFDTFNVQLHGVSRYMVRNKPTFDRIWPEIEKYFIDSVVVAHNASFDLGVLSKVMHHYGLEMPEIKYSCTVTMARKRIRSPKYSLDVVSSFFGVDLLRHHNAMADTKACQGIFLKMMSGYGYSESDVSLFKSNLSIHKGSSGSFTPNRTYTDRTIKVQEFLGIIKSIIHSDDFSSVSIKYLKDWMNRHPELESELVYKKIKVKIEQGDDLRACFNECVDPVKSADYDTINIDGKLFCMTGNFSFGSKTDVELFIIAHGGKIHPSVTRAVDYVLVGNEGDPGWSYGSYGAKVKKAMEMKEKGYPIKIISEKDLFGE